jgi:hypothetical protein
VQQDPAKILIGEVALKLHQVVGALVPNMEIIRWQDCEPAVRDDNGCIQIHDLNRCWKVAGEKGTARFFTD